MNSVEKYSQPLVSFNDLPTPGNIYYNQKRKGAVRTSSVS